MTNTNINTVNTEVQAEETKKLSKKVKFAIFVVSFVVGSVLLSTILSKAVPGSNIRTFSAMNILSDAVLGSIIGYFVFLRKRKTEKA